MTQLLRLKNQTWQIFHFVLTFGLELNCRLNAHRCTPWQSVSSFKHRATQQIFTNTKLTTPQKFAKYKIYNNWCIQCDDHNHWSISWSIYHGRIGKARCGDWRPSASRLPGTIPGLLFLRHLLQMCDQRQRKGGDVSYDVLVGWVQKFLRRKFFLYFSQSEPMRQNLPLAVTSSFCQMKNSLGLLFI